MPKKKKVELVTIKVTKQTVHNLNVAAAFSKKTQYEVAEEGSYFIKGKYFTKPNK